MSGFILRSCTPLLALASACTVSDVVFVDHQADGGVPADAGPDAGPDVTPPETLITVAPDGVSGDLSPTIEFTADEPATFWCLRYPDDAAPFECTSPLSLGTLFETWNIVSVRAVDLAGNVDATPAEAIWRLDPTPPVVFVQKVPAETDNDTSVLLRFDAYDLSVPTYECSLDGAPFSTCVPPWSITNLSAGDHEFMIRARDAAGNQGNPYTHDWTVDPTPPNAVIVSGPSGSVAADAATFTFSSPNAGAGASFECSLDGASFSSCTSPQTYASLTEASHGFSVRVRNASNVVDPSPAERVWRVDLTVPDVGLTTTHNYSEYSSGFFQAQIYDENGASFSEFEYECTLDEGAASPCPSPHAFVLRDMSLGEHTLTLVVTDEVGNRSAPVIHSWTVDTVLPDTVIESGPGPRTTTANAVFDFTASEEVADYWCKLEEGASTTCTDPFSVNVDPGVHTLSVVARDRATNRDLTPATYTWTFAPP